MIDEPYPATRRGSSVAMRDTTNLADLLERILDKGIVIAGDITINLVDIELLTIKVRLLIASVDKAREIGMDWWEHDEFFSSRARKDKEVDGGDNGKELGSGDAGALSQRLDRIERAIERLGSGTHTG
jgi:hypothetical protein